jgi:K+-transporting ATPase ATPase C chain
MFGELMPGLRMVLVMTALTGLVYPALVTGIARAAFRDQADGSLIVSNGQVVGSRLIGQTFTKPEYVHPRPSAAGSGYDATASGGTNLGPTSRTLVDRVRAAVARYREENDGYAGPVPADAVTASASGLDPHISPANARAQAPRVAKARRVSVEQVLEVLARHTEGRTFGIFGEPRVNVLDLNLDLDRRLPMK